MSTNEDGRPEAEPQQSQPQEAAPTAEPTPPSLPERAPRVTVTLLALMALLFVAELVLSLGDISGILQPDIQTLVGLGGSMRPLVLAGEWWRLAGLLVLSRRISSKEERQAIQSQSLRILVPSLIPIATRGTGGEIDFAGHVGGALTGLAVGGVFLVTESCEAGEATGCRILADLHRTGRLVVRNDLRAQELYGRACDGGDAPACEHLPKGGLAWGPVPWERG